jgi:phage-related protein
MNITPLIWIGSSLKDLRSFPEDVRYTFGYALYQAQNGGKSDAAKPLKGFGSAGILEVVEENQGDTYRAVYTVRFKKAVYVLHCFQKKSTRGARTSQRDIDLIKNRLKKAERDAKENGHE